MVSLGMLFDVPKAKNTRLAARVFLRISTVSQHPACLDHVIQTRRGERRGERVGRIEGRMESDIGEASSYFSFTVYGIVNNCVSTMITMINEDKDRLVVMAVLSSIEEILKTMKKEALQEPANVQGLCDAVKNVLLSKVSACPCTLW